METDDFASFNVILTLLTKPVIDSNTAGFPPPDSAICANVKKVTLPNHDLIFMVLIT
jgi:hypothetical protein